MCATDGVNWTNKSYWFTTESDSSGGNENPGNNGGWIPPSNNEPIADANGSYAGFVDVPLIFNGSGSTDDGMIESYEWDFGDNYNGNGVSPTHTYREAGKYTITLTITDDGGETDTDTTYAIITNKSNNPPRKPTLEGPTNGDKDILYSYSVKSTDIDNNSIKYILNWGDGTNTASDFFENDTIYKTLHKWTDAGIYSVTACAKDENNATSEMVRITVLIDSHYVENIGYLLDNDGDETYDSFHENKTGVETDVEKQNDGKYLIDEDGDGNWDYTYVSETGEIESYKSDKSELSQQTEDNIVIVILAIFLIIISLILLIVRRSRKNKLNF